MFNKKKKAKKKELDNYLISQPLTVNIINTSTSQREFILFGSSINLIKTNLGNHPDIIVKCIDANGESTDAYNAILYDLLSDSLTGGKLRIQTNRETNLSNTLFFYEETPYPTTKNSSILHESKLELSLMRDAYQFQRDVLDITTKFKINKRAFIKGVIEHDSMIRISFFPTAISSSLFDNKESQLKIYKPERLSGKNVAPVIVQYSFYSFKEAFKGLWKSIKQKFSRNSTTAKK